MLAGPILWYCGLWDLLTETWDTFLRGGLVVKDIYRAGKKLQKRIFKKKYQKKKKKKKKNPGVIATHNDQVIANIHCFRSSSTNLPTLGRYLGLRKGLRMVTVSSKHVSFVTRRPSWIETVSCHFRYLSSVSANHEGSSNPARNMETASSATHLRGGGGNHATSTIPMMDGCD